jgi:hypothetical protein
VRCQACGAEARRPVHHVVSYAGLEYVVLCRACHEAVHGEGPRLVELFEQHVPVVESGSQHGRYACDYVVVRRPDAKRLTVEDLEAYVRRLNEAAPSEGFTLKVRRWRGRKLHVVTKASKRPKWPTIPLYFDLESQRFYVREVDLRRRPKLTNYVVMRALGMLGVAQGRYAGGSRRRGAQA